MDGSTKRSERKRTPRMLRSRYDSLRDRGSELTFRGQFRRALRRYRLARLYADRIGEPALEDAADLNVAMVLLQLGQAARGEEGLREILLRTSDPRMEFNAAYYLASSLRAQARHEKAQTYAVRALDRARRLRSDSLIAAAEMLLGNILLAQSYTDAALEHYHVALEIRERETEDNRYSLAILLENIGYCLMLGGDPANGITHVDRALELATEVGDRRCEAECLQDLCYGHLLAEDLVRAAGFGERGLELAREQRYDDVRENCHYLLGEIRGRLGDDDARDEHFESLQELHPELPFLRDFLCAVDVTRIITLKR